MLTIEALRKKADLFWSRVDKTGECWTWSGSRFRNGYGRFECSGTWLAHRAAAALTLGAVPALFVLHCCDNPPCVNPAHLFLGTHTDNMRDAARKGRLATPLPEGFHCGVTNPRAKLTETIVREFRARAAVGEALRAIAAEYGVSKDTVRNAVRGLTWSHVQ